MRTRIPASLVLLALLASCGPAPAASSAPTAAAPSPAAPSPSSSPAPAHAGVGSTSTKLSEVKSTTAAAIGHVNFIGEEKLPAGSYLETLSVVTLQPGGRTVSHKHGGTEWVFVIDGSVEIRMGGGARTVLNAGQNAKVPANTPLQAHNAGTGIARFLAFFVTADGQPFQTNLETAP